MIEYELLDPEFFFFLGKNLRVLMNSVSLLDCGTFHKSVMIIYARESVGIRDADNGSRVCKPAFHVIYREQKIIIRAVSILCIKRMLTQYIGPCKYRLV